MSTPRDAHGGDENSAAAARRSGFVGFGTGKTLDDADPSLAQAGDAFVASGLDIRALIAAVTTTDAFLTP